MSSFTLMVGPGLRAEPQPLRVVHNGRFSLPTGRYRADVLFVDGERPGPRPLSLQFGRTGPPLVAWTVDPSAGPWSTEFSLPADVGFVGFRGGQEIERAIRAITITPLTVTDESRRPHVPQVLAAARYGWTVVLFHDDWTAPEPTGFWVLGRGPTQITLAAAEGPASPSAIELRTDHVANHVTLRAPGWIRELDLKAGEPQQIDLPPASRDVVSVTIEAEGGFVPSELDPASKDKRLLGVWVDVR